MKRTKNDWLVISSLFILAITTMLACKKTDNSTPPVVPKPTITSFSPDTAASGATVTITGTDLTGATAVSFGGIPAASFTVTNSTTISAVVGSGGSGDVSVTTPGGTATLSGFVLKAPEIDGYNSSDEVQHDNIIAHWAFDGTATESVHGENPVLMGGAQSYVTGRIGQAIHLDAGWLTYGPKATDAGEDNTTYGSNDTLQNGYTLSVWAQVPDTSLLTNLFQLSTPNIPNWPILGMAYRKHADNSFDIDGGLGNVDGTGPHLTYAATFMEPAFYDSLDWTHIVITYNGSDKTLHYYANGILRNVYDLTTIGGTPFPDVNASLLMIAPNYATIGTFESTASTPGDASTTIPDYMSAGLTGNIDDVRFYKTALTDDEVKALFDLGTAGR